MTQDQVAIVLAGVLGYAQQWMRGYRWYSDGVTLLISLALALVGALLIAPDAAQWRPLVWSTLSLFLSLLGGTSLGHMAAQLPTSVMLAPKSPFVLTPLLQSFFSPISCG